MQETGFACFLKSSLSALAILLTFGVSAASAQAQTQAPMSQTSGPNLPTGQDGQIGVFLKASFAGDGKPIRSGVVRRIYDDRGDAAPPTIVARSSAPASNFALAPGNYVVHAAYGFAGASKRITVQSGSVT